MKSRLRLAICSKKLGRSTKVEELLACDHQILKSGSEISFDINSVILPRGIISSSHPSQAVSP